MREAQKLLAKSLTPEQKADRAAAAAKRKAEAAAAKTKPAGSPDLRNSGADEIITSIQADTDKLEDVARASIVKLSPDKLCAALTEAWREDQLIDLQNRLVQFLNAKKKAA